jgi:alkaline phosphatase D
VEIRGVRPSRYRPYDESIPNAERVRQVIDWFRLPEPERPHFVTAYFSDVDTAGHRFGPGSVETEQAVAEMDQLIGTLLTSLENTGLPINVFIVSDHGMLQVLRTVSIGPATEFTGFQIAPASGSQIMLYSADRKLVEKTVAVLKARDALQYAVHQRLETPERMHYRDNWRIGDIVVIATAPVNLQIGEIIAVGEQEHGSHGYDPAQFPEMRGIFYARGPDLKSGVTLEPFESVNIYPLIAQLLRLKPPPNLDGTSALFEILKVPPAPK